MAAFKIALSAGHGKNTAGKRCLKSLDPKETREWVLNSRIADKIEQLLGQYTGWELKRLDDVTGAKDVALATRSKTANAWGADFYLALHHNAGVKGGKGGGIVAFVYTSPSAASVEWQKALYAALIEETGLKGNRATPLAKKNLHECREPKMPAVLLELGFMDSSTDVPQILSEAYADKCAKAIVEVLVERGKLTKKPEPKPEAETEPATIYRVQVGAYAVKANAEKTMQKLKAAGFEGYITKTQGSTLHRVQVGAYAVRANAEKMLRKVQAAGFQGYITTKRK